MEMLEEEVRPRQGAVLALELLRGHPGVVEMVSQEQMGMGWREPLSPPVELVEEKEMRSSLRAERLVASGRAFDLVFKRSSLREAGVPAKAVRVVFREEGGATVSSKALKLRELAVDRLQAAESGQQPVLGVCAAAKEDLLSMFESEQGHGEGTCAAVVEAAERFDYPGRKPRKLLSESARLQDTRDAMLPPMCPCVCAG